MFRTLGPSTPVHTCSHCAFLHTCLYRPHHYTVCAYPFLFIPVDIWVHTCVDWTHLFTPAHSSPHLSSFANSHAPCLCSHLPVLALRTCPYILPHLHTCDLTLVRGNLGALRLKVRLVEDRVLPSEYYQPLVQLLMESVLGLPEVGASGQQLPGGRVVHADLVLASPAFKGTSLGSSASGSQTPGHLTCLLSLPRRMMPAPWQCWS